MSAGENDILAFAIDNAVDAVYLFNEDGRILHTNSAACEMLGYSGDELMAMSILDLTPDFPREEWPDHIRDVRRGQVPPFEVYHHKKDGGRLPVEITVNNRIFEGKEYFCAFARDITERKEAERQQRELNFIIDNATDAVYTYDYDGRIRYANQIAAEETGYSREELMQMTVMDIDPDLTPDFWEAGWNRARHGRRQILESRHQRKDGSTYPVEISQGITLIDGKEYSCAFVRDITERKQAEKRDEELTFAIENAIDAVYLNDEEGNIYYANQAACQSLGYTLGELTSMNIAEIDPGFSREVLKLLKQGRIDAIPPPPPQTYHRRKDGSRFPVEVSFNSRVIDGAHYYCSFVRDVTDKKKAQSENETLRAAIENATDAVYIIDSAGNIRYANQSAAREMQYSVQELQSMTVADIDPTLSDSTQRDRLRRERWDKSLEGERVIFETIHRRKDGSTFPVECSHSGVRLTDRDIGISFSRNITERKKELRQTNELRFAIENSLDAVFMADPNGNIYYVNKTACEMLGYTYDELTSMAVFDIDADFSPEKFREFWNEAWRINLTTFESEHRRKDGTRFPVEISTRITEFEGFEYACTFARDITERKKAMRDLEEFRFVIDHANDPVYLFDSRARILYANRLACETLGYTRDEMDALTILDIDPEMTPKVWEELFPKMANGEIKSFEATNRKKDGSIFPVEVTTAVVEYEDFQLGCAFSHDITERNEILSSLTESEERFRVIAETSPVALIISRVRDGTILYANRQTEMLFGKPASDIVNQSLYRLLSSTSGSDRLTEMMQSNKQIYGQEIMIEGQHDRQSWYSLNTRSIILHDEEVICSALLDITESHKLAEQLSYHASFDVLTDLVNRREFQNRLQQVILQARKHYTDNALCFLDLDQFKIVNDTCGHIAGDELLRQLSQLLQENIRKRDILARLGGDEFAIILESCGLQQAERVANAIRESVRDFRFHWEDHSFNIGVSIGIVPVDSRSETVTDVLRRADTACYAAKDAGRNRIHIYHPDDEELARRHGEMQWISRINKALEENHLQLWFQKILPLTNQHEQGEHFEILLRLEDSDGNLVLPGSFLPTAERYGIAPRIDRWVITTVMDWYRLNPEALQRLGLCSINLSGQSLGDEELLKYIIDYFEVSGLPAGKFCFEITETTAIANLAHATHFIKSLKAHGCRFALDDFGSGLSSFAYLKNLPVDFIKIDGLFVQDILDDPIDLAMVKSINDICHVMNKITIAEFVENRAIQDKLGEVGVDYVQGYGIARPEPLITGPDIKKIYN